MKPSLLTNLLIILALGLCGLCTFQWLRETETNKELGRLHHSKTVLTQQIQQHTNSIQTLQLQLAELENNVDRLQTALNTNEFALLKLQTEHDSLQTTNRFLHAQIEVYTGAFQQATNRLEEAYSNIKKQNDLVRQLTSQRDDYVHRLNQSIEARNQIVTQYNDLVKKVEAAQPQSGSGR